MTEFQQQQETKHQEEMKKVGEENLKKAKISSLRMLRKKALKPLPAVCSTRLLKLPSKKTPSHLSLKTQLKFIITAS